jgi:nitrate/nitrite transporter NarK
MRAGDVERGAPAARSGEADEADEVDEADESAPLLAPASPAGDNGAKAAAGSGGGGGGNKSYRLSPGGTVCNKSVALRLLLLALASAMCFGAQVAYDSVGAAATLIRRTLHVDAEAIGDLYSAYHLPNTLMVILGGIFADRVGTMIAAFIFSGFICTGTVIVAFAAPFSFRGMLFGRAVFGLGAESLTIVQISMLTKWFSLDDGAFPSLALSMSVAYSVSALGTVLAYDTVPFVGQSGGLGEAMWGLGAFPCFVSFVAVFALSLVERFTTASQRRGDRAPF